MTEDERDARKAAPVPLAAEAVELNRLDTKLARLSAQSRALRKAMLQFGKDFDAPTWIAAFNSSDLDDINRVYTVTGGYLALVNNMAEALRAGTKLTGTKPSAGAHGSPESSRRLEATVASHASKQKHSRSCTALATAYSTLRRTSRPTKSTGRSACCWAIFLGSSRVISRGCRSMASSFDLDDERHREGCLTKRFGFDVPTWTPRGAPGPAIAGARTLSTTAAH